MRTRAALAAAVAALAAAAPAHAAPDPLRGEQWNLDMVESDAAHATAAGAGAVVAVIDSGVNAAHPDLAARLLPGRDFVQDDDTPQDTDGHGTHVTGIVVANKENGAGISSVAPAATVLPLRVLGEDGSGSTEDVAAAIDYAVAHGAHVINLSLGSDVPLIGAGGDEVFNAALGRAAAANVTIVAAAGNNSVPICEQPAISGRLLCVGAADRRRGRSFYSSAAGPRGVTAPGGSGLPITGEDVLSTWNDGKYMEVAGTSQAAPHVSGVAALLVSLGLRGQAVADRILATATDAGTAGPDDMYGAGILNAKAAVAGLKPPETGPKGKASVASTHRIASVLKKGIRVTCRAATAGRCTARIVSGSTTLAYGSAKAKAGQTVTLTARVTKAGKQRLQKAKKNVSARAEMAIPGAPTRTKSLKLLR
ncbi:MAG TPA: S8 family serine peptidase [Thermoleophilaceae bacterium]